MPAHPALKPLHLALDLRQPRQCGPVDLQPGPQPHRRRANLPNGPAPSAVTAILLGLFSAAAGGWR